MFYDPRSRGHVFLNVKEKSVSSVLLLGQFVCDECHSGTGACRRSFDSHATQVFRALDKITAIGDGNDCSCNGANFTK